MYDVKFYYAKYETSKLLLLLLLLLLFSIVIETAR